ncbi:hypothetical protein PMZ80_007886 [Knufia obscura]|uniref:Uncharacterized protein n=1 Tax=Knufia obscura TaxID=1635080 RepID=A0ABR0RFV9_9EURO|nr:hypothetical protein PMZ80_007886 [Knufia obscura]
MPRGAEYANEPPQSDNAIEQGQDAAHGVGKTTDEAPISGAKKTAPMPEGLSEVNDRNLSAGSSGPTQSGSGHGGNGPNEMGENKGLGMGPGNVNV